MAQLATTTLRAQFLPTFAESLAKRATRRLEKLGVEVQTGVKVEAVDQKGLEHSGAPSWTKVCVVHANGSAANTTGQWPQGGRVGINA